MSGSSDAEQAAPAVYIKVIFALLVGLRVWDDWLESEGTNLCRTCHRPKVFLGVPGRSCGAWYRLTELLQTGWLTCWV